jgi:hypothetical protein
MATTWTNYLVAVPPDATTVWIVRLPFFDTPIQATYDAAGFFFTWIDSNAFNQTIQGVQVFKWRHL